LGRESNSVFPTRDVANRGSPKYIKKRVPGNHQPIQPSDNLPACLAVSYPRGRNPPKSRQCEIRTHDPWLPKPVRFRCANCLCLYLHTMGLEPIPPGYTQVCCLLHHAESTGDILGPFISKPAVANRRESLLGVYTPKYIVAPPLGFEPRTFRLTAGCTAIVL
jgi:hypothetical protein